MTLRTYHLRLLVPSLAVVVVVGYSFYGKTFPYHPERWTALSAPAGSVRKAKRPFSNGSTPLTSTFLGREGEEKNSEAKHRKNNWSVTGRAPDGQEVLVPKQTQRLSPPRTGISPQQAMSASTRRCTSEAGLEMVQKKRLFYVDELTSTSVRHLLDKLSEMERKGIIGKFADERKVLIYNKVGKCGSRALLRLLRSLGERNRIVLVGSVYSSGDAHLSTAGIFAVTRLVQLPPSTVYHRHIHFLRISRASLTSPRLLYFNMLRHPFDRAVSAYYFNRFGDHVKAGARGYYELGTGNETFDECVQHRRNECTDERGLWHVVPYFCGQSRNCIRPSRWALVRAKQHVEREYLFVGIAEYFNETLQAMERLLPEMFTGARELWDTSSAVRCRADLTRTKRKQVPLATSRRFVLSRMKLELEFYAFVKDRFLSILQRLEIPVTSR